MLIEGGPLEDPSPPLGDLLRVGLTAEPDANGRRLGRRRDELARAGRRQRPPRVRLPRARTRGGRAGRVADAEPDRAAHPLPRLLQGRARRDPAELPLHAREIDHALGVSGASVLLAHAERSEDLAASELVGGLSHGVISYSGELDGASGTFEQLVESEPTAFDPPADDPADPAAIFFTSGSTGPSKGVTHTRESLRWMIAERGGRVRADLRGRVPAGLLDVAHRLVPLGARDALGRRQGGRRAHLRQPRDPAAAARAPARR